jgi:hypothetical protein
VHGAGGDRGLLRKVWSWDITKLLGPVKWTYYYLYVLLDIFSRYVVGWLLARQESAALAKALIAESCERQSIGSDQLIIYPDRGPSMTSQPVALLLAPSAWCPRIADRKSRTITPSPRPSSRPSSIGPTSRTGSAPTRGHPTRPRSGSRNLPPGRGDRALGVLRGELRRFGPAAQGRHGRWARARPGLPG